MIFRKIKQLLLNDDTVKLYFYPMRKKMIIFLMFCGLLTTGCKQEKRYHTTVSNSVDSQAISQIVEFQNKQNELFKNPETSPLKNKDQKTFKGLDFFPADTNYIVTALLKRKLDTEPFLMTTTTDRKTLQVVYGVVHFELNDVSHKLEVYKSMDSMDKVGINRLFLPFFDETNGTETYGGGRYIDLEIPRGDTLIIDFNRAYNPYCVYNKKYSCPIVPRQNYLKTTIRAGVKNFESN